VKTKTGRWRISPALVVMTTTVVVIAAIIFFGWLNARSYRVKARVEIASPEIEIAGDRQSTAINTSNLTDGEVARTATRVRDATGLLMGLAAIGVTEQMKDRNPSSADSLIRLMAERNLFPPGISPTSVKGTLISDRATIYVRYRSHPLGIEIVSLGRERLDGPALIVRLDAGSDDNSGALLLIARKIDGVNLPEPFAPTKNIAAMNWSVEPLRERQFSPQEIEALNQWVQQYDHK
jgi:hypothetical protein